MLLYSSLPIKIIIPLGKVNAQFLVFVPVALVFTCKEKIDYT